MTIRDILQPILQPIVRALDEVYGFFSPITLFTAGEQGAWYDPSDLTTLFQDSAGTTPVTAVEQPVGLMLDKSKGLVLGSELVTNGDFSNGTAGWTNNLGSFSVSGGMLVLTEVGTGNAQAYQAITTVVGKTYKVNLSGYESAGGDGRFLIGTSIGSAAYGSILFTSSNAPYQFIFTATGTTTYLSPTSARSVNGTTAYFGNISVKELLGNHAFQSTAGNRPTLSARVNLLTKTEDFSNAVWAVASSGGGVNGVKTPNYGVAPDGTTTACRIQLDVSAGTAGAQSQVYQAFSATGVVNRSLFIKTNDGTTKTIQGFSAGAPNPVTLTVTPSWTQVSTTESVSGAANFQILLSKGTTSDTADLLVWHPDVRVANNGALPRTNLLTYSEQFDNAAWVGAGTKPTVTANTTTAPDGTLTADTLFFSVSGVSNRIQQSSSPTVSVLGSVISVYLKGSVGGESIRIWNGWDYDDVTLTTSWARYTHVGVDSNLAHQVTFMLSANSGTPTVYAWGAQLEANPTATAYIRTTSAAVTVYDPKIPTYQRVNTSTDYDTNSFPLYLSFNGTSSAMATNSIDFSAGDKMTVFAGVRKLSDAAAGIFMELSANAGTTYPGSFYVAAPELTGASGNYSFKSSGSVFPASAVYSGTILSPVTNVLTAQSSISTPSQTLRVNGSQVGTSSVTQGTGNYGNYPLYIGARAGASLFFNGQLYSLIVRGAQSSAAQITSSETYVDSKTKAY